MIPGKAAAALPARRPKTRARALSLFLNHSLSLFGFFGGGGGGEEDPPPPVRAVMIVEMSSPMEVKTAVIVKPCSLKMSLIFSRKLKSSSRILLAVCRILENCDASSRLF